MDIVSKQQKKKIHPHKFTLWVAMGSIIMMFAGLTSAFIVKSNQAGWKTIGLPKIFWVSTAVILISSIMIQLSLRSFKNREMTRYRLLLAATMVLGIVFVALQWIGFNELWAQQITFKGSGAGQFLYVIFGLHAIHIIGGIVALAVMLFKAYRGSSKLYSSVPVEVMATYWHFVDLLWVYLLVFFIIAGGQ
ncbi:MAG TPA: cytochrome c oxidase subunit 3 [Chitinophagaceae bacterium]|nr:cytochrome c oxidase subunit 3 [Chitinophagales bacterium]HPG12042.1 cytochrome c oxidase subunit 3 [Chitinophagaceae bacterium]HRX94671.1 cytochrome c oxidase subunit 3 [Chitinophagaceae bacterium]